MTPSIHSELRIILPSGRELCVGAINTTNPNKLAEYQQAGLTVKSCSIELPELQPSDRINQLITMGDYQEASKQIAEDKAKRAFNLMGRPVLVEDTALYVRSLPNVTGPLIKQWTAFPTGLKMLSQIVGQQGDISAVAHFTLAVANADEALTWTAEITGCVTLSPRGDKGFGWDSIFIPNPESQRAMKGILFPKTYAEMSPEEIQLIAPRRSAVVQLLRKSLKE